MTEVEQFYNERMKQQGDPEFNDLLDWEVDLIENTFAFALWRLNRALNNFAQALEREADRLRMKMKHQGGK